MDVIASDQQQQQPAWPMYRALVGVGLACGLLIVGVFLGTAARIEHNRQQALQQAIFKVVPDATSYLALTGDPSLFAAYGEQDELLGFALPAQAMGYQDVVRILYGYDPERQAVVGISVLESKETPGLGDKIETDPVFLRNFVALDVTVDPASGRLANTITLVKPGQKNRPWEIDAISGATISSAAIATMLAESTANLVPRLHAQKQQFRQKAEAGNGK